MVCGAGSAGCVVAARLSEDPTLSVLLLEAGPDYPVIDEAPDDVRSAWSFGGLGHDWGYLSDDARSVAVERGKVVGGSSAVNASNASRPSPHDFERWVGLGADDWTWDAALPWLRRLEDDPVGGEWHGRGGPLPIRRFTEDAGLRPVMAAFLRACGALGHAVVKDLNAPDAVGAGPIPLNQVDGARMSAAVVYLDPARGRPNLEIRSAVVVDRIEIAGGGAHSVLLAGGERLEADHVVLCAGAIGSPSVLLRSGVGPADELVEAGVEVVLERDGVGRNLRDHPMTFPAFAAGPELDGGSPVAPLQVMLTTASWGPARKADVELNLLPHTPVPGRFVIGLGLVRAHSVGRVTLRATDPEAAPRILLDLLGHPDDLPRLVAGVRLARRIADAPALASYVEDELWPGPSVCTDGAIAAAIQAKPASYSHASGTCGMGGGGRALGGRRPSRCRARRHGAARDRRLDLPGESRSADERHDHGGRGALLEPPARAARRPRVAPSGSSARSGGPGPRLAAPAIRSHATGMLPDGGRRQTRPGHPRVTPRTSGRAY